MDYYYAIYFFDGKMLTITSEEMSKIKTDLSKGSEFIQVQGNFINIKSISRVGEHESTAQMKILDRASVENRLLAQGKNDLVENRRNKEKMRALNNVLRIQQFEEANFEAENDSLLKEADDVEHFINKETKEKMYS